MLEIRETLAVVDDKSIYGVGNLSARRECHKISCLRELLECAESFRATHIWIMPGTNVSRWCSAAWDVPGWNIVKIGDERIEFMSARRDGGNADSMIYVGFVEYSRWPWLGNLPSVTALIQTVAMLENALGVPLEWTPAHVSMKVVRRLNTSRWPWWKPLTINLEKSEHGLNYANDIAQELHWPARGVEPIIPPGATHTISIDGNSEYASAMTGLNVGEGNPEWDATASEYDGKRPGFWQIKILPSSTEWDGQRLPSFADRRWMTTDMIEQISRMEGIPITIQCGWYWPRYHQSLRSTAEYLWAMRNNYRDLVDKGPAYQNTYDTIRAVIKAIHGKMARADTEPHFRRRDIWAMVVARAVAMRLYKIEKIYREYGLLPVRIKADEFTYAVNDPHIFDGMLGTSKLGGFKLVEIQHIS